jgi:hypothetical protein
MGRTDARIAGCLCTAIGNSAELSRNRCRHGSHADFLMNIIGLALFLSCSGHRAVYIAPQHDD